MSSLIVAKQSGQPPSAIATLPVQMRTYILHDRVFCARCTAQKPTSLVDDNYGRMRPYFHKQVDNAYYRCLAHDRGYAKCGQSAIAVDVLDQQLVSILSNLDIPADYRDRIEHTVRDRIEHEAAFKRMEEIQQIVERIDISWEHGFMDKEEYLLIEDHEHNAGRILTSSFLPVSKATASASIETLLEFTASSSFDRVARHLLILIGLTALGCSSLLPPPTITYGHGLARLSSIRQLPIAAS